MDEPSIETHPDDDKCPMCGLSVLTYGSQHFTEIYDPNGASVDEGFCSWRHFAEWAARGEPEFPPATIEPWETSNWERAVDGLVLAGIATWTLLAVFGLYTLVHRIW